MFWNAPIPAWAALLMVIVLALLIVYFALLAINRQHATESSTENKQRTIDALITERDGARAIIKDRDLEIANLQGELDAIQTHFTIMSQALDAAQAEVERLQKSDLMTLPLTERVPLKRPPRGGPKKGGQA